MSNTPNIPTETNQTQVIQTNSHPRRRRMIIVLITLVFLWSVAMFFRMEIRARWWAYRLTSAESLEERNYYLVRLMAIGDKSLGSLDRLLDDPREDIREMGVSVLHYCSSERARHILLNMLGDESEEVTSSAGRELAFRVDAAKALGELKAMIGSQKIHLACAAAVALERIGGHQAQQILIETLTTTTDADLQAQLIDSLGMLGSEAAIPVLIDMLADNRPISKLPASQRGAQRMIKAMQAELMDKGIAPALLLEATQIEPVVASAAARALRMITGTYFGDPSTQPAESRERICLQWRAWWKDQKK